MESRHFIFSTTPGGCGDITVSHTDIARERENRNSTFNVLQSKSKSNLTPTPKRKSGPLAVRSTTPLSRFTASNSAVTTPKRNLDQIKLCLEMESYETPQTASPESDIRSKAVSMENLTPAKKIKEELKSRLQTESTDDADMLAVAGGRLGFALVLAAWRRRRSEAASLRRGAALAAGATERSRRQLELMQTLLHGDAEKLKRALAQIARLKRKISDCEEQKMNIEMEAEAAKHRAEAALAAARHDITGLTAKLTFECMATLQAEEKAARLFIELDKKQALLAASESALQAAKKSHTLAELQWVTEARKPKWRRPFDRLGKMVRGWLLGIQWQRALLYTVVPTATARNMQAW